MKYLLFISLFFVFIVAHSQSETVMLKSVETYGGFASIERAIYIIEGDGDSEKVDDLEKHNKSGIPENMKKIKTYIDIYLKKGYKLISSEATSFGWNGVFTVEHTYIFEKNN